MAKKSQSGNSRGRTLQPKTHAVSEVCTRIYNQDCIGGMLEHLADNAVHLTITSPPFEELFTYSGKPEDVGNNGSTIDVRAGRFALNLRFLIEQLYRVHAPGTNACIHIQQLLAYRIQHGFSGRRDFRGAVVDLFRASGWNFVAEELHEPVPAVTAGEVRAMLDLYEGNDSALNAALARRMGVSMPSEIAIWKDPQALRDGTRVLTPDGWVPIESLQAGDRVIGSTGSPVRVMGVYRHEPRPLYRVRLSDGSSVDCDAAHRWGILKSGPLRNSGRLTVMTTGEMLAAGVKMECGEPRYYIPMLSAPVQFTPRSTLPIAPYTLGCLLGDGNFAARGHVRLTGLKETVDRCHLPATHSWRFVPGTEEAGGQVATYSVKSASGRKNAILDGLRQLGLHRLRAWEKFVPPMYLLASPLDRLELLRGLLDTDGTAKLNGTISYTTTSPRLASDVAALVESLGGQARRAEENGGRYTHGGEVRQGRSKYLLAIRLPCEISPFKLSAKLGRLRPNRKQPTRFVESIEPVDAGPCTCIEVDAPDRLYVTEHCILTHNTMAQRLNLHSLQFKTGWARSSTAWAPAVNDYVLVFQKPGDVSHPVRPLVHPKNPNGWLSQEEWISWARGTWDIDPMDILDGARNRRSLDGLREAEHEKHVCALQREVIRRCLLLYSNPVAIQEDVLVLDPFSGIGSTAVMCVENGRNFVGFELKESYYRASLDYVEQARKGMLQKEQQGTLFDTLEAS